MISSVILLALGVANAAEWYEDACLTDCWYSCDDTEDCNLCQFYGDACAADCSAEVQAEFDICYNVEEGCTFSDDENWCSVTDMSCFDPAPAVWKEDFLPMFCYWCPMDRMYPMYEATWKPYCEAGGYCFYGMSTVSVLTESGATETKKIEEVKVGQKVLARTTAGTSAFKEVMGTPHSKAKEDYVEVKIGKKGDLLRATLHHTFPTCSGATKQARQLKSGDCLLGTNGKAYVHNVSRVKAAEKDNTYTLVMEEGVKQVAVGGVFTDTMRTVSKYSALDLMTPKGYSKPVITKAGLAKAE